MKQILCSSLVLCGVLAGGGFKPLQAADPTGYPALVLHDAPVAYWRLGESFVSAQDVALNLGLQGAAQNGAYVGVPAHGQPGALVGSGNTATRFDGTSQGTTIPYSVDLNTASFTAEAWVKPEVALSGALTCPFASAYRPTGIAQGWIFYQTPTNWNFRMGDGVNWGVNVYSAAAPVPGQWYYLAATFDGSTASFFVNGELAATAGFSAYVPNASAALGIGMRGDSTFLFTGTVDEAAVYPTVLLPDEILGHYQNGINASPSPAYDTLVLGAGPNGYWRLDDPALPVAANLGSLGAAANGVYVNGVTSDQAGAIPDDTDTAIAFDGANGKVDVPFNAAMNSTNYSFECWAMVTGGSGNYRSPITSRDDGPQRGFIIYATPGNQWEFWSGTGSAWDGLGGGAVTDNQWTHLVGTYDGAVKRFYVNGVLMATNTSAFLPNTARGLRIGGGATEGTGNYFFNGVVDEVAVYDRALSLEEIDAHYYFVSPAPPMIVQDIQGVTAFEGARVTVPVVAVGSPPLRYQWFFFGSPLPTQTNATLVLPSATTAQSGSYYVEVSNDLGGPVQSSVAEIDILPTEVPTITQDPQSLSLYAGGRAEFAVVASGGSRLTYQWQHNQQNLLNQTNATLILPGVTQLDAGDYWAIVGNAAGLNTSAVATLTVIVPTPGTYAAIVAADHPVSYWRLDEADGTIGYDVYGGHNGTYSGTVTLNAPGALTDDLDTAATFDGASGTKLEVPYSPTLNPSVFSIECWANVSGGDGNYRSPLTSRADSPTRGFIFYASGGNHWEFWNGTGGAAGTWSVITGPAVVDAQWVHLVGTYDGTNKSFYVNGVLAGVAQVSFAPNNEKPLRIGAGATDDPVGNFFFPGTVDEVAVYDTVLSAQRVSDHYAASLGPSTPPTISTDPVSITVLPGDTATFTVGAVGSTPLTYRWQFGGADLPGQTNSTLTLTGVTSANAGEYQVIVANLAGEATSGIAVLTVATVKDVPYSQAVVADGPVSYWRLGETSGTVAADEMGLYPGQYMNDVALGVPGAIPGDSDPAASFLAGQHTKVEVPFAADLNPAQFSLELWAKVTGGAGNYRSPFSSRDDLPQRGFIIYAAAGNTWEFWSGKGDSSGWDTIVGPTVQLGSWVYLVATYDGTTKRFFVNGRQVGTSTGAFGQNTAQVTRIGGGATENADGSFFFEGSIDEVALYASALDPAIIMAHYALGTRPTLVATLSGSDVVLTWTTGRVLQQADTLAGPWTAVTGATSPWTVKPEAKKFYRLLR
jgi:hypothetical protein